MFTALAALLLVAWAVALSLWARSYWVETRIERSHRQLDGRDNIEQDQRLLAEMDGSGDSEPAAQGA